MYRKALALIGTGGLAACAALWGAAPASATESTGWLATLKPIAANQVKGSGTGWITLTGDSAAFTVQISGLLRAPHVANIHIDAQGTCPGDGQAKAHNGHPSITVTDGAPMYGRVGAWLTTTGDTKPNATLAVNRFPAVGDYTYQRTFGLDPAVVANLKKGTAVLVVHGIDYNRNGKYDAVLGASELLPTLPAEATDPALCGAFVSAQMPAVPNGPVDAGGGSAAAANHPVELALGGAALLAAAGAGLVAYRRRRSSTGP